MIRPISFLGPLVIGAALLVVPGAIASPAFPGQSGVIRFQDQVAFFIVDPASGLMSFHGIDASFAQICSGAPVEFDEFSIQLLNSPSGPIHALITGQEHSVYIYPAQSLPNHIGPQDCPVLAGLPVLAKGKARLVRTDNDLTGSGAAGANAYGWSASGNLTDSSGRVFQYSETMRGLITPQGFDTGEARDLQTSIRLIPKGR